MPLEQANITLGTAGHIDHGKTLLLKGLTGCDTDRLKEEKERGMSIDLGFAPSKIADLQVGIVDVPGHENFVKTMVAGASGMDGVILVIAADDGVMPQTREHLDILTLLGVQHGIVALTKIDRVESDIATFLRGTFLDGAPILPVCSLTGDGFGALHDALAALVRSIQPKRADGVFRLPVERSFSVKGYGTVVCGIPVSGSARIGDEVVLLPQNNEGRVRAIQVYKRTGETVVAGQCVALNVRHWDHRTISRGDTVAVPGYYAPHQWCAGKLRLLPHEGLTVKSGAQVKLHVGTSEVPATVYLMEGSRMAPGEEGIAQVRSAQPLVTSPGDRFIVRTLSPVRTVGGGTVIEPLPRRLKRNRPELVRDLTERAEAIAEDARFVEYCVKTAGAVGAREGHLSARTKVPPRRLRSVLETLTREEKVIDLASGLHIHIETLRTAERRLLDTVEDFHRRSPASPGLASEALERSCDLRRPILRAVVERLLREGRLVERHHRLALPEHCSSLSDEDRALLDGVEALFRRQPFRPPVLEEVVEQTRAPREAVERALKTLTEHDRLVPVKPDLLFHTEAVDRAREQLVAFIRKEGGLESVKFKYLLDTSRKYAIPLLDYFDRTGLTRRVNNTRYLRSSPPT